MKTARSRDQDPAGALSILNGPIPSQIYAALAERLVVHFIQITDERIEFIQHFFRLIAFIFSNAVLLNHCVAVLGRSQHAFKTSTELVFINTMADRIAVSETHFSIAFIVLQRTLPVAKIFSGNRSAEWVFIYFFC